MEAQPWDGAVRWGTILFYCLLLIPSSLDNQLLQAIRESKLLLWNSCYWWRNQQ